MTVEVEKVLVLNMRHARPDDVGKTFELAVLPSGALVPQCFVVAVDYSVGGKSSYGLSVIEGPERFTAMGDTFGMQLGFRAGGYVIHGEVQTDSRLYLRSVDDGRIFTVGDVESITRAVRPATLAS